MEFQPVHGQCFITAEVACCILWTSQWSGHFYISLVNKEMLGEVQSVGQGHMRPVHGRMDFKCKWAWFQVLCIPFPWYVIVSLSLWSGKQSLYSVAFYCRRTERPLRTCSHVSSSERYLARWLQVRTFFIANMEFPTKLPHLLGICWLWSGALMW